MYFFAFLHTHRAPHKYHLFVIRLHIRRLLHFEKETLLFASTTTRTHTLTHAQRWLRARLSYSLFIDANNAHRMARRSGGFFNLQSSTSALAGSTSRAHLPENRQQVRHVRTLDSNWLRWARRRCGEPKKPENGPAIAQWAKQSM